jgi:cytoskeletal protein CcmA (bactofilin family)
VNIGKSVVIKGELSASEDLTIEGQVEGKVDLRQNTLTIGTNARITAQVSAKVVIVMGHVHGNISATEKVDIRDNGSVDGDLSAPRVAIAEGAHFRGSIDMQQAKGGDPTKAGDQAKAGDGKPAPAAAHTAPATPHAAPTPHTGATPPASVGAR